MLLTQNDFKVLKPLCRSLSELYKKDECIEIQTLLSSGVDSVAITHFLATNKNFFCKLFDVEDVKVSAYHFNHKLRNQNNIMQAKASALASQLGIDICIKQAHIKPVNESQARDMRMQGLCDYKSISLTGHHLDDCVESYLLNVLRGHENRQPIPFATQMHQGVLLHLFLFTAKKKFYEYVQHNKLEQFIEEDETNKIVKGSRRNLLRNEIIPILDREKLGLQKIVKKKMLDKLSNFHFNKI